VSRARSNEVETKAAARTTGDVEERKPRSATCKIFVKH